MILPPSLPAKPSFLNADVSEAQLPPKPRTGKARAKGVEQKDEPEGRWHTPWMDALPMTKYENKEQRLHDEIVAFIQYVQPTSEETSAREKVVKRLTDLIQRRFADCEVKIFGSVAQGLSLPGGDVDITIRTTQVYGDYHRTKCLFQLSRILRDSSFSDKPFVVANAKVPILTFETRPPLGQMKFDININADDGCSMIPLIKTYLDTMPALRPLLLLVKAFLARRGLNSAAASGLGSYASTLLIISFLQLRPGDRPKEAYNSPMESESLGLLMMDFMEYYADKFPYETSYISVVHGQLLPKASKGWLREKQPDALSIESIVDTGKDVGRACGKIGQIRTAFREASATLKAYPLSVETGSILGSIVGISDLTIEYRKRTSALIQSGDLDRAISDVTLPPSWNDPPPLRHNPRDGRPPRDTYQRDRYPPPSSGRRREDYPPRDRYRSYPDNRSYPDMAPQFRQQPYVNDHRPHSDYQQYSHQPYRRPHCPW